MGDAQYIALRNARVAQEVDALAEIFAPNAGLYSDTMASLGCDEADALVHLFRVAGYNNLADSLAEDHVYGEYPEDRHWVKGKSREDSGTFYG